MIDQLVGMFNHTAAACGSSFFFGLPTWYKYLESREIEDATTGLMICQPLLQGINDVWLIAMAALELILRVAALLAIGFIVWGGIQYIKSQGYPDNIKKARDTIIYACAGLAISVVSTVVVTFIAGRFN